MFRDAAGVRDAAAARADRTLVLIACVVSFAGIASLGSVWLLSQPQLQPRPAAHLVIEPAAPALPARTQQPLRDARDEPAQVADRASLQHPLTAEHRALYRDTDLLTASWQSLQAHDFDAARQLLARHRAESSRAYDDLNDGLAILADCMQRPSAEIRARAQRFYDEQTYSMARRRIRRYCLEAPPRSAGAIPLLENTP